MSTKIELKKLLIGSGADAVGYADISHLPADTNMGFGTVITILVALDRDTIAEIYDGPTMGYYDEYKRANTKLDELAVIGAEFLKSRGVTSKPMTVTQVKADRDNRTALPHKTGAILSGLGWIGKCALLVTKQYGSAVRMTSILTNIEGVENTEPMPSLCGDCVECVDACPGSAMTGANYVSGMRREDIYDASACRTAARQRASEIGIRNTICGICIGICPWTRKYVDRE